MKRDSKFELLRIVSMFMIIIFHFDYFGQQWRIGFTHSFTDYVLLSSYLVLGKLGVYLFIMITGYFIGNKRISITKSLIKSFDVWIETFYYSVGICIILALMGLTHFSINQFITCMFPFLSDQYWFVDAYLILLILSPFINITLNQLSKRQFMYLILIVSFLASALAPVKSIIFSSELQFGYVLPPYIIGAYIRKYNPNISFAKTKLILLYIVTVIIAATFYQIGRAKYINVFFFGIPQLLMSTVIFIIVKNQHSYVNKYINGIASTIFASYLITDNMMIKTILWGLPILHSTHMSLLKINLIGIGLVICLMLICSCIDYVRIFLFKYLKINIMFSKFLTGIRRG